MSKLNDFSLDELLEALDDSLDEGTIVPMERTVKKFVITLGLTPGPVKVPNYVIYYHYRKIWESQGVKVSKVAFGRELSKQFGQTRSKNTRYFLMNEGVFDLTEEHLNEAKKYNDRIEKHKKTKKEKDSKK